MRTFFLAIGLLLGMGPLCIAGQIYKWVDAQGVTHFGAQPPQGQEATSVVTPSVPAGKPPTPPRSDAIALVTPLQSLDEVLNPRLRER